jgi:hypothetical protein
MAMGRPYVGMVDRNHLGLIHCEFQALDPRFQANPASYRSIDRDHVQFIQVARNTTSSHDERNFNWLGAIIVRHKSLVAFYQVLEGPRILICKGVLGTHSSTTRWLPFRKTLDELKPIP